ncbi:hypothetical protein J2X16_002406 [Pelomonas aquatica]|uniref:Uncharacterized protein n=2 Tax=Pelomonas aquatica TaxID=431058 RepID=A0ABU1Z8X5_9BURK|nr:hypothetical protein [Pelomonas aquatica]
MSQTTSLARPSVRVVMHISPAGYVAGILAAQRRSQSMSEFLEGAVAASCAQDDDGPDRLLPWGPHAMDLFLQLADTVPDALRGPWKVLYAKVLEEPELWATPQVTVDEHEAGELSPGWHINETALRKAWPRLVSSVFLC